MVIDHKGSIDNIKDKLALIDSFNKRITRAENLASKASTDAAGFLSKLENRLDDFVQMSKDIDQRTT